MSLVVKYIDAPEGAREAAQVSGDTGQTFSSFFSVVSGAQDIPYATLEPGIWTLDGTRKILPDAPKNAGWWSESRSDENGRFDTPPQISISFPDAYTATAVTFVFSPSTGQWCNEIQVSWYNDQILLAESTAYPDAAEWVLEQLVEGFNRIDIQLIATNQSGQFAKLQLIQIGKVVVFGRSELISVRLTNEVDPSLCYLPVDTLRVEVQDRKMRVFSPQENQRMEVYRDGDLLAAHYIMDSGRESRHYYTFSCQSAIGLLSDEYLGGIYEDVPLEELLADVLDGRAYALDASFVGQTVRGYLPVCTRREALQQIAFALGAMVTTQGYDAICLWTLPEDVSAAFTNKQIFTGAKAETSPRIARFELAAHSYKKSSEVVTLISNQEVSGEDQLFTFYEPHYDYTIEGGVITDSGANWVKITAEGAVSVNAKTYIHNMAMHTKRNVLATAAERNNVMTVDSATLIHGGNVQKALERLYSSGQYRQTVTQEAIISGQRAGDLVDSVTPWETQIRGYITSMESTLTQNGRTAAVTILGTEATDE